MRSVIKRRLKKKTATVKKEDFISSKIGHYRAKLVSYRKLKGRYFSSDADVIAAAENCLAGQLYEYFFFF